jgi:hypothetical protein
MFDTDELLSIYFSNRRRLVKEKRVVGSKIEKLLDVFPQVVFSSGIMSLCQSVFKRTSVYACDLKIAGYF